MPSSFVSVTTPGMQRASQNFEAAVAQSKSQLGSVQGEIAALGVAWTGNAAVRFGQSLNRWSAEFQNVINQLNTILNVLHANSQAYTKTEAEAQNTPLPL